ncbi:hypothetical protein ACH5RR_011772 [Cinchona calisaya]|uniref:Uncharacterized protein n=1 Tax=Cinchona calisaya TaxID=153742 RepID=A0ABD3A5U7_9GENT
MKAINGSPPEQIVRSMAQKALTFRDRRRKRSDRRTSANVVHHIFRQGAWGKPRSVSHYSPLHSTAETPATTAVAVRRKFSTSSEHRDSSSTENFFSFPNFFRPLNWIFQGCDL